MMNFVLVVMKVNGRYLTFLLVKILTMIGLVVPDKFKQTLLVIGVQLKKNKRKKACACCFVYRKMSHFDTIQHALPVCRQDKQRHQYYLYLHTLTHTHLHTHWCVQSSSGTLHKNILIF